MAKTIRKPLDSIDDLVDVEKSHYSPVKSFLQLAAWTASLHVPMARTCTSHPI